jgi:hypothetical protein
VGEGVEEIAVGVLCQALQLIPPVRGDVGVGVQREPVANPATTSWLFRAFGELGLDRPTGTIR